ncbi:MAG: sigma-70 family RNA polymerase sigma factor, partial [Pirellulales bacterium]|nr:sigma-70 family RNA polymerase sigma factor [Pirellulales bacterium]
GRARLHATVYRSTRCPHLADDIVQEAFARAFQKIDMFRGQSQFYTWLFRITRNVQSTYLLKYSGRKQATNQGVGEAHRSESPCPAQAYEISERRAKVRLAIGTLRQQHQQILQMRVYEDLAYREIANRMGIDLGTVKSKLARAKESLKRELEREPPGSLTQG